MAGLSLCRLTDQHKLYSGKVTAFTKFESMDFYFWGFLKDHVYQNNPQTIAELKVAITQQNHGITREECVRVIDNFKLQACYQHQGAHLEHVL